MDDPETPVRVHASLALAEMLRHTYGESLPTRRQAWDTYKFSTSQGCRQADHWQGHSK